MDAKEKNGSEEKSIKAAVITVSDKGARGERVDESGPAAKEMLEEAGYVLTADESAYITRNNLEFLRDWSAPEEAGLSMEQQ